MKKATIFVNISILLALFMGLLFVGCIKKPVGEKTSYIISIDYDGENTISGCENVCYVNNTDNALSFLQFNLFANAFQDKDAVVTVIEEDRAYYNGFNEGKIEISSVESDGEKLEFSFDGDNNEIMKVLLVNEIYPDEKINIEIEFTLTLADINHRLGRGKETVNLGNFYPILSVYENGKGFYKNIYQPFGDPFYSQVASYQVEISYPQEFNVASSGIKQNESKGDKCKTIFKGENMRDFALVLSKNFDSISVKNSACEIEYYGYRGDTNIKQCLQVAQDAVTYFSKTFGNYPYKKLSVVKNSFVQGGMEYPSLVMISDEVDNDNLNYVIVHEVAHQWWYGVVGNNQYETAWLDEGLAEQSTLMFFRDITKYNVNFKERLQSCYDSYKLYQKVQQKVYGKVDEVMDKSLDKFSSSPDYVAMAYTKSTLMLSTLEETLGKSKFNACLKGMYKDFSFKEMSKADFIAYFSTKSHRNLEPFFKSWLDGEIVIA